MAARNESPVAVIPGGLPSPANGARVLVVDDEPILRRAHSSVLKRAGYTVETAEDGAIALERLTNEPFDVVVTDIAMPKRDGISLLRKAREKFVFCPFIILTGQPALATAISALELGAMRYLVKPFGLHQLTQIVGEAAELCAVEREIRETFARNHPTTRSLADSDQAEERLLRGLTTMWMEYDPIIDWSTRATVGHEVVMCSREPGLETYGALCSFADSLDRRPVFERMMAVRLRFSLAAFAGAHTVFVPARSWRILGPLVAAGAAAHPSLNSHMVLQFEGTELSDSERNHLTGAKRAGAVFALSGFGIGGTRLEPFVLLRPKFLKIHRSIVKEMPQSAATRELIRGLMTFAGDLGVRVVAEGVDTPEECDAVLGVGCTLVQGAVVPKAEQA